MCVVVAESAYLQFSGHIELQFKPQTSYCSGTTLRFGSTGFGQMETGVQKREPSSGAHADKDTGTPNDRVGHQSKPGENGEIYFGSYPVLRQPIWTVPPVGSEMPPREAFALTKEMIEFRAKKNVIAVTFANFAFMDFVINWVRHLTDYEVTNILVGMSFTLLLQYIYLDTIYANER